MHLHQSNGRQQERQESVRGKDGGNSKMFDHFVGGLQKYLPQITPLLAPNVNSFRRMRPSFSAPMQPAMGLRQTAPAACACRCRDGRTAGSRTASRRRR